MPKQLQNIVNAINLLTQAIKGVRIIKAVGGGMWYISSSAGTTITIADTFYRVAGTYGTIVAELFSMSSSGLLTYIGDKPIDIFFTASISISSNTNNVLAEFSPAINGVVDPRLVLIRKISTAGDVGTLSGSGLATLLPGDEVEVKVTCGNAGAILTAEKMIISIHSVR